ncbi:TRAP transporter subunit DctM [Spirochaetia bacterium]|nr:TRAP transporter subunit DctM [Spirochaetia bacterium]GHV83566.1 TRAP transporter subunit DctM [Spirochaetia bacterium]
MSLGLRERIMKKTLREHLHFLEKGICYGSLVFLVMIPVSEAFARLVLHSGIPSSSGTVVHLLLVLGLFAGMITTEKKDHLSIGLIQYITDQKIKNAMAVISGLVSAFVCIILAFCSASFIKLGLSPWRLIGFIPDAVYALVMPLGYAIMARRFARHTNLRGAFRVIPIFAIVLGIICSLPVIFKFIYGFDLPKSAVYINNIFFWAASKIKIVVLVFLILSALTGTPLFVVIVGIALIMMQSVHGEIDVTANQIYTALTQNSIVAIPLFTLTGFFLSESRAGLRLVAAFRAWFSWMPGGMIAASVIICAFFTSFTGASGVTILALGGILYTILAENSGYPKNFSIGLLASCGSIGLLFPPSLPIILVGATTQTNILHLFAGGLIPGIILIAVMVIFSIIISFKTKIPVEKFNLKNAVFSMKGAFWEILLPFLLISGYFTGILSLVEIGAFAALYVFVIEVFVCKDISLREIPAVFNKAVPIIGGILSILAVSQALSYYIVDTQLPENFARWLQAAISSKWVFLLILNAALLVVGCLMDIFSAILIVLPLLVPLATAFGIDKVHLGIIFLINMEAGFLTPPVGLNLFVASYRFQKPFLEICRAVVPFLLIQIGVVLLITFVPELSTFLTRYF